MVKAFLYVLVILISFFASGDVRVLVDIAIEGVKEATDKLIQKHASNPIELARGTMTSLRDLTN